MPKHFIKNIIFTKSKLKGCYRFKDDFQIYPLNIENAPQGNHVNNIPCCFEFYYEDEDVAYFSPFGLKSVDKQISELTAQNNKRNRILNLLSTITNYRFHFTNSTDIIWGLPVPEVINDENREDINNSKSLPFMEMYAYPNMYEDFIIKELSKNDFQPLIALKHGEYYMYDPVDGRDKYIKIPITIDEVLEKYYNLDKKTSLIIDSATYQLCNALDLFKTMKSLSFFSAVSAIETMVNLEYKHEKIEFECNRCQSIKNSSRKCKECNKPVWGIAEKFRDFLTKYVSDGEKAKKAYSKIYNFRSKIAHTEFLLFNENILDWKYDNKTEEMSMKHIEAIQTARLSIVNWILKN